MSQMSQIRSLYRSLFRRSANIWDPKKRFAVVWFGQIHNLDTGYVCLLGLKSVSERLSSVNIVQVSLIGQLLLNRPVDWSRSILTVDKDSPTWEYGRYRRLIRIEYGRYWRSIRIHLLENTVNIWSTVDLTQKSDEINRQYGFIPKKIGRYRLWMCPHTKKNLSTVEIDRRSRHGLKKIVNIDLNHPYFLTNRCKWLTSTLASFHGDQFQALLTKQHTRKKQSHTDKV